MTHTQYYHSPLGSILIAADEVGLTGLWFHGQKYSADTLPQEHIQKETGQIAMKLPHTSNNSYHNGCQCHRIDLSAQLPLRKRYKTHKIPDIERGLDL